MVITKYCTVSFAHSRMVETRKSTEKPIFFPWITTCWKKIVLDHFVVFLDICQFCHLLSLFARLKLIKSNKGLFLVRPRFPFHSLLAMKMLPKSMKMQIKLSKVEIKCNVAFLLFVILGNYSHINWLPSMLLNFWLTCYKISYSYLRHGTLLLSFVSEISLAFPTYKGVSVITAKMQYFLPRLLFCSF